MSKTDLDIKLISLKRKTTSNETKHLKVKKTQQLNSLTTNKNNYSFFLDRIYFTSNDGFQNTFVNQPTLDMLEIKKKAKALIMLLVGNQREHILLNLSHYILLSYIT